LEFNNVPNYQFLAFVLIKCFYWPFFSQSSEKILLLFQILSTNAWAKYYWNDTRLSWFPDDWDNISLLQVEAEKVFNNS
jgi:hypothetical protein